MNAIYVGLILMAWFVRGVSAELVEWKLVLAFAASLSTGIVSWLAMRFENQSGRLLFDTNPLKIGKRWRHKWTGGLTANLNGEFVVAFLGPDCPYCAQWVRLGNAVSQSSKLPQVVGVVAATKERTDAFKREHSIRFPLGTISQSLMGRLAQAVPTTVRVDQGVIRDQWVGSSPPAEFVDRLKDAFFPQSASKH
jgi:hypothetical protein